MILIFLKRLTNRLDAFTEVTGKTVSWLNLGMVAGTMLVVILRYLFHNSSVALQESVIYLHGMVFLLGSAYTLKHNEHVRVDILYQKFSVRGKALINLLGTVLLLLPVIFYIALESWDYILQSWRVREVSQEAAGLPWVYLLKTLILAMVAVLGIQAVAEIMRNLILLIDPNTNPPSDTQSTETIPHA